MPRMTRAALRAQEVQIAQDSTNSSDRETSPEETSSPATGGGANWKAEDQSVLGEVSGNSKAVIEAIGGEDQLPAKKQTISRSKGKKIKQALNEVFASEEDNRANQAQENSGEREQPTQAEEEASESKDSHDSSSREDSPVEPFPELSVSGLDSVSNECNLVTSSEESSIPQDRSQVEESEQTTKTPPSTGHTPKFDPEEHTVEHQDSGSQEDSFVTTIRARSPSKQNSVSPQQESNEMEEDSFADEIRTRSPVKPLSRIEDSVEAMDALEEALEQVVINLPNIPDDGLESPVKTTHDVPRPRFSAANRTSTVPSQKRKINPSPTVAKSGTTSTRSIASRPKVDLSKRPTPPTLSFSNSPIKKAAVATQPSKPKVATTVRQSLSTSKPAFVPTKSSKPPTRPTFSLPGEAIAAKLKAQREERMKQGTESSGTKQAPGQRQQQEVKKPFKARPVPRTSTIAGAPVVRETAASKARQSLMHVSTTATKENIQPSSSSSATMTSRSNTSTKSSSSSSTRPSTSTSTSNTIKHPPHPRPSTINHPPRPSFAPTITTAAVAPRPLTASDITNQRVRAKALFARDTKLQSDLAQAKKEKEDAAKKARAEAAERGRKASREWAERQKMRLKMMEKGKGDGMGMGMEKEKGANVKTVVG